MGQMKDLAIRLDAIEDRWLDVEVDPFDDSDPENLKRLREKTAQDDIRFLVAELTAWMEQVSKLHVILDRTMKVLGAGPYSNLPQLAEMLVKERDWCITTMAEIATDFLRDPVPDWEGPGGRKEMYEKLLGCVEVTKRLKKETT